MLSVTHVSLEVVKMDHELEKMPRFTEAWDVRDENWEPV